MEGREGKWVDDTSNKAARADGISRLQTWYAHQAAQSRKRCAAGHRRGQSRQIPLLERPEPADLQGDGQESAQIGSSVSPRVLLGRARESRWEVAPLDVTLSASPVARPLKAE